MALADSDFAALDVQGYVAYHNVAEHEADAWRRDVRQVARQQGWKIRTGYKVETGRVWSVREGWTPEDPEAYQELIQRILDDIGP